MKEPYLNSPGGYVAFAPVSHRLILWRAGLRIQEALSLTALDLDPRRGSVLVRRGKGGRRREIGMDVRGFEHIQPWLDARRRMPVGPLFCVLDGRTRGRA